jgi:hypothetical protein
MGIEDGENQLPESLQTIKGAPIASYPTIRSMGQLLEQGYALCRLRVHQAEPALSGAPGKLIPASAIFPPLTYTHACLPFLKV